MFVYEKKLQYPVKIRNTNPKLASLIITQYGGPKSDKRLQNNRVSKQNHRYFVEFQKILGQLLFVFTL